MYDCQQRRSKEKRNITEFLRFIWRVFDKARRVNGIDSRDRARKVRAKQKKKFPLERGCYARFTKHRSRVHPGMLHLRHRACSFSPEIFAKAWVGSTRAGQGQLAICIQIKNLNDEILVGEEPTSIQRFCRFAAG